MSISTQDAYNEMMALISVGIQEASDGIFTEPLTVRWPYTTKAEKPPSNKVWCEVVMAITDERQSALSTQVTDDGLRVYDASGTVGVIVRIPVTMTNVGAWYLKFASKLRNKFRKAVNSEVWYRNTTISNGLDAVEEYYMFSVTSDFTFSEIV